MDDGKRGFIGGLVDTARNAQVGGRWDGSREEKSEGTGES